MAGWDWLFGGGQQGGPMAPMPRNPARAPAGLEQFAMDATVNPMWDVAKGLGAAASGYGTSPEAGAGLMAAMGMMSPMGRLRPYQGVPDQLMGFRRNGPQRGFHEENFKHEQWLEITLPDGTKFVDAIKGLNKPHALERAHRNWDAKEISPISFDEAAKIDPGILPIPKPQMPIF